MRIKGIDLYTRMIEMDKTLIYRRIYNEKFGECDISLCGVDLSFMGIFKKTNENILSDKTPKEINEILTSDWDLLKQPVTWQEAIEARMNRKKIYFMYNGDRYEMYDDVIGVCRINNEAIDYNSREETIGFDMLINGEWFIED